MAYDKILDQKGEEIQLHIELSPGEVLAEELEARHIGKSAFAMKIGVYPSHFSNILKSKRRLNASIAFKLEKELGISAEFWVGLQANYELAIEREKCVA